MLLGLYYSAHHGLIILKIFWIGLLPFSSSFSSLLFSLPFFSFPSSSLLPAHKKPSTCMKKKPLQASIPCMWIFRKSLLLIPTYKYVPPLRDSQLFQKIIDFLKLDKYPMWALDGRKRIGSRPSSVPPPPPLAPSPRSSCCTCTYNGSKHLPTSLLTRWEQKVPLIKFRGSS